MDPVTTAFVTLYALTAVCIVVGIWAGMHKSE